MKKLLLEVAAFICLCQMQAQTTVTVNGQISNLTVMEPLYLDIDGILHPVKLSTEGVFSLTAEVPQIPSFFAVATMTKKRKIVQQTPLIWFGQENISFSIDWHNKSYKTSQLMPYQTTSEQMQALKGEKQIQVILNNPPSIPGLYFAYSNKKNIPISDLETFSKKVNEENRKSIYFKRIESYLSAIKRSSIKKGAKVEAFSLPNKDGAQVSVAAETNKKQLIAMFSSGCAYSIASIDLLKQLAAINNNKIEMITIWGDKNRAVWLNTHEEEKRKITWTNLWDEYGFASAYLKRTMWPTFYVINENGELADSFKGYKKKTAKKLKNLVQ